MALATLGATALSVFAFYGRSEEPRVRRLALGHIVLAGFSVWLILSYVFAYDPSRAEPIVIDYAKIIIMMTVSAIVVRHVAHIRLLTLTAVLALCYIGYEVNFMYLVQGYLGIYHNGYGGTRQQRRRLDARDGDSNVRLSLGRASALVAMVFCRDGSRPAARRAHDVLARRDGVADSGRRRSSTSEVAERV